MLLRITKSLTVIKIKLSIVILLFGCYSTAFGQDYDDAGAIFEMIREHTEMAELFENRDQSFQIEQYKLKEDADSLKLTGGCLFSFLDNEVIQTCVFKKHPKSCKRRYWKWAKNEVGDKFGNIEECNKKGIVKWPYLGFKTTETTILNSDSIVDQITWWVNSQGDTSCHFLDRWVFQRDTLVEYWHNNLIGKNCSWENSGNYSISKYQYPFHNTTIIETFFGTSESNKSLGKRKVFKLYNQLGQLISVTTSRSERFGTQRVFEDRYFYESGKWKRTERWYDGVLTEKILKITVDKI